MSVSIVPCPGCNTLLLSDTAQCPTCKHVFDADRAVESTEPSATSDIPQQSQEVPCPDCGEMCRPELVRCFNCGGFIRAEIAESYQRMQEKMLSDFTNESSTEDQTDAALSEVVDVSEPSADEDDDFELAEGVSTEDDDFELADGVNVDDDDFDLSPDISSNATATPTAPAAQPAAPTPTADDEIELVTDTPSDSSAAPDKSAAAASPGVDDLDIPSLAGQESSETQKGAESLDEIPDLGDGESSAGDEASKTDDATQEGEEGKPGELAATGDALLDIAMKEEKEVEEIRKNRPKLKVRTGFIIFCPNGHQVEVQDKHRGKKGKCPKCKSPFLVPHANWETKSEEAEEASETTEGVDTATGEQAASAAATNDSGYRWMADVHVHTVDPTKLKLKVGSLETAFETFDFGFNKENGLLSVSLTKGGLFGAADKKKPEAREAMLAHLAEDNPLDELPVADKKQFDNDMIAQMKIVQPATNADESMFAGIEVFGEKRVAIRIPKLADDDPLTFVSFGLSDFREFHSILSELYEIKDLVESFDIPLTDSYEEVQCHYSEEPFKALEHIEWYQADPTFEFDLVGRECQGCGLIVSEDMRKKEKIGGANGKGIAKAKCPKCENKFGDTSLYTLAEKTEQPSAETEAES